MKRPEHKNKIIEFFANKKILDVGCGEKKTIGSIGLDFIKFNDVNVVHDLNSFPYPFKDNSFDLIIANHVIEHVANIPKTITELSRILKTGGKIWITTPHYTDVNSYIDCTHIFHLTSQSFNRFTQPPNTNLLTQELCYVCLKSFGRRLGYEKYLNKNSINRRIAHWEKFKSHVFRGDEMRFVLRKN